jgi:ATP-dependent helicase/nuclease subunit A
MTELADAAWRQMIERRLDLNMLVEAGAGSGKTHSLASRMAAGIVSGRYQVDDLAAVTFTRKAAAELRGRFQLALERGLPASAGDERARIERALAGLERLFAGTIHSFCAHLLRERPVEAGVAPGFTELDALQDETSRRRAWRDYLAQLREQQSPELDELQQARISARDLDHAFQQVCTFDEVDFPVGTATKPDLEGARAAVDGFRRQLNRLMPKTPDPDAKCKALEKALQFGRLLRAARKGRDADLVEALRCWEHRPEITMKWWAGQRNDQLAIRERLEHLIDEFQADTVHPFLATWRHYVYRTAMTVLIGARDHARDRRRRTLTLNYGDLLAAAASLLRRNRPVRAAMQRKYRWLLVDEFQDTDPIQAEVMLLLAADESDGSGVDASGVVADPFALRLRAGALFVVGDPKQSIYRFRRADIDVYYRVAQSIERGGGKVVPLTTSFRARPALCRWNNHVFTRLLPGAATAHQAGFAPLDPDPRWKPQRSTPMGETGRCTLTAPGDVNRHRIAEWDSERIARFIRSELDAGRAVPSDFLVLTRKRKSLRLYAAALEAAFVPVEVSGAGAFGGSPAVLALVDLLRALADPADAVAVIGVLRGRLFGVSDRQLFEHRQAGGHFGLSARRRSEDDARERRGQVGVLEALDCLEGFLRAVRALPLAAAVERIVEDCGLLALAASEDAGAAAGDVLHAVDIVRAEAEGGGGLADAADALEQAAESSEIESVPLEPGRPAVVRVMNLHKAKGLEARVVFLADPLGAARKTADVRIVRDGATARGYLAISKAVGEFGSQVIAHAEGWDDHQARELAFVEAEETRLLYVAATRARELLVVSRWDGTGSVRPWAPLDQHLRDAPELEIGSPVVSRTGERGDLSVKSRNSAELARARRRQAAWQPSWGVTRAGGHQADTTMARAEGAERGYAARPAIDGPPAAGARADAGPAWGSLVHALLEHAAKHGDATRADLARLAAWLVVETPDIQPYIEDAVDLVEHVRAEPFWAEAHAGAEAQAEVPFSIRIAPGERCAGFEPADIPRVVRGVIDLVYRAPDGWRILDYKTDVSLAPGETLLARHTAQLACYAAAWERATSQKAAARGIVGLRAGTVEWA